MADDDWFGGGDDEAPPAPSLIKKEEEAPAAEEAGEAAPAGEEAGAAEGGEAAAEEKPEEGEYLDPSKLLIFKHWIRPKFLQYNYLYNYRYNYYNDVIDYLDKRQRGLSRELPRPQTWAERALRTYTSTTTKCELNKKAAEDTRLLTNMQFSGNFYRYHMKEYINKRVSNLLA